MLLVSLQVPLYPFFTLNLILISETSDPFPSATSSQQSLDASFSRHSLDDTLLSASLKADVHPQAVAESVRDVLHGPSDGLVMDSQELDSEVLSPGDSGYSADRLEIGGTLDGLARDTTPDAAIDEGCSRQASHDRQVLDLQKEIDTLNARVLRAESDSGGQLGGVSSELPHLVRSAVSDGFASMEHDLPHRIGLEVRSEVSRIHENLVSELSALRDLKRATEANTSQIKRFGSTLAELVGGQTQLQRSVTVLTTRVDTLPTSISHEVQSKVSTPLGVKLDTLSRLVRSSQQNAPGSTSTPLKSSPLTPVPSPVPRVVKECHLCGGRDHVRADCPKKRDWCVRCAQYGHRHSNCQDRDLECELCLSQGRSSLALGHHKYVNFSFTLFILFI